MRSGRAAPVNSNCVSAASPCRRIGWSALGATRKSTAFHAPFGFTAALNLNESGKSPAFSKTSVKRPPFDTIRQSGCGGRSVSASPPESSVSEPPFGFVTRAVAVRRNAAFCSASVPASLKSRSTTCRVSGSAAVMRSGSE